MNLMGIVSFGEFQSCQTGKTISDLFVEFLFSDNPDSNSDNCDSIDENL